jgi:N6-adenosine-specific RNA methylase IME4
MLQQNVVNTPIKINSEYLYLVPRPTDEEYRSLEADIVEKGRAIEPIKVNSKNEILDGYTRYDICKKHSLPFDIKLMEFSSVLDEKIYVVETNLLRRNLTVYVRLEQQKSTAKLYEEKAKKQQGTRTDLTSVQNCIKAESIDVGAIIAKKVGVGRTTYYEFKKIDEEGTEEQKQSARCGKESISRVFRKIQYKQNISAIKEKINSLIPPKGEFEVIVVDPPWNYGDVYDPDTNRVASPYPEMSTEEIMNIKLPVNEAGCMLFLWATNAYMHDAYHVIKNWGFTPHTILTWVKDRMGIGYYLRGITEHCIIATKGKPVYNLTNQTTVIHAKNLGHSIKPPEFYDFVDGYAKGRKLDYFSRKKRVGWETFGTMEITQTNI